MSAGTDEMICLARATGTHGLRGDIKLHPKSPDAFALLDMRQIVFRKDDGTLHRRSLSRAVSYKNAILVRLEGAEDINAVQDFIGCDVLAPLDALPKHPEGALYWAQIEGLNVVDARLGDVGTIADIFSTPAHDVYVVNGRFGEVLVPVVDVFIDRIDLKERRMYVDLPDGLVPEVDEV